jgi:DNA polymerase-3 subunit alpha
LHILPPDINKSDAEFTIDGNAIRFGLLAVKGIGAAGLQEIRLNRPFESLAHFEEIIPKRKCNSAARAALVDCGAFDTLGERSDWSVKDKSSKEKDILGLALSSAADVVKHRKLIEEYNTLPEDFEAAMLKDGMVQIGGEIIKLSDHSTKKGNPYTRVIVEFDGQETKINFWQDEYAKYRHMLAEGAAVIIAGEYDVEYKSISARYCVTAEQLATEIKKEKK